MEAVLCISEGSMPEPSVMTRGLICSRNRKLDWAAGAKMDGGSRVGAGVRRNRGPGVHCTGFTYVPSEEFTREF